MADVRARWFAVALAGVLVLGACGGGGGDRFSLTDDDPEEREDSPNDEDEDEDEGEAFSFELTEEELARALEETETVIEVDDRVEIRTEIHLTGNTAIETSAEVRVGEIITEFDGRETDVGTLLTIPDDVLFDFDDDSLRPDAAAALDRIVEVIAYYDEVSVEVIGHTDSVGSDEYNQDLSERRAHSVVTYLVHTGIDGGRLNAVGRGRTEPVADNDTEEGRQQNRRVEILLVGVFSAGG